MEGENNRMDDDPEIVEEVICPSSPKQLSLNVPQKVKDVILEKLMRENPNLHGKKLNLNIVSSQVGFSNKNPNYNFSYSIMKKKKQIRNRLQDPMNLNNNHSTIPRKPVSSSFTLISLSSDEETAENTDVSSSSTSSIQDDLIDSKDRTALENFRNGDSDFKDNLPQRVASKPPSQCSSLLTLSTDEDIAMPVVNAGDVETLTSQDLPNPSEDNPDFISVEFLQGKCNCLDLIAEVKKLSNPLCSLRFKDNWTLEAVSRQALVQAFGEKFLTNILSDTNACEDSNPAQLLESSREHFEEVQPSSCDVNEMNKNALVNVETQTEEFSVVVPESVNAETQTESSSVMVPESEIQPNDQILLDPEFCSFNPRCDDDIDVDELLDSEEEQEIIHQGPKLGDLPQAELLSFLGLCTHQEAQQKRDATMGNRVELPRKSKRNRLKKR